MSTQTRPRIAEAVLDVAAVLVVMRWEGGGPPVALSHLVGEMTYAALDLWRTRDAAPDRLRAATLQTVELLESVELDDPRMAAMVPRLERVADDLAALE